MVALVDDNESYDFLYRLLIQISEEIAKQYVQL